ncbi:MAG: FGGY-family carbohydrate kinase [Cyanobacteria bacterium J06638_28]
MVYAAGLDFGTSGARIAVIDRLQAIVVQHSIAYPATPGQHWGDRWLMALQQLLQAIPVSLRTDLQAISINGTSATVLLCDQEGIPLVAPLLYNDDAGKDYRFVLDGIAPSGSPVLSATSSLVKLLWWQATLPTGLYQQARYLMHQADWLACQLHGQPGLSDYHNALKLGYDVGHLNYPEWLSSWANLADLLPRVQAPGSVFGRVSPDACDRYGLPADCSVIAGTTDSIAAFLASGAQSPGEAVTSLGSTLVLKLLSTTRIDDERYGIYSHRLGDLWLVGGASNTGGRVLQQFFTNEDLQRLSPKIQSHQPSGLTYYPLTQPGERFPINDPTLPPQMEPRPEEPERFLHGLLEGMARIEAQGYQCLQDLGATSLTQVFSAGGGAHNPTWTTIRQQHLGVPTTTAKTTKAAFGTACLAQTGVGN